MRKRTKTFQVDEALGTSNLAQAKAVARARLDQGASTSEVVTGTLEQVAIIYKTLPLKCSDDVAAANIGRLRAMVKYTWGKELAQVKLAAIPDLWTAFVAKRQGREAPGYTRCPEAVAINSALRQARCLFIRRLHPFYRKAGIIIPQDAENVTFLPEIHTGPPPAEDAALITEWERLRAVDLDMWVAVGLARFAGLRQIEILHCRGKWIKQSGPATYVVMKDRPEDGFLKKTEGPEYWAEVLHPELAEYLRAVSPEARVITGALKWLANKPQAWLRPFTGAAKAPLHRLRGLYADHVRRDTEAAILARREAPQAASEALGHTNTTTTERHYIEKVAPRNL